MFAYYGYTALIWIVALWVTDKYTFVIDLFDRRDSLLEKADILLEKAMMGVILFIVWSFSVIFLPWFIWHHWSEHRAKIRWEKMVKDDVKRKEEKETEFDSHWGDDL